MRTRRGQKAPERERLEAPYGAKLEKTAEKLPVYLRGFYGVDAAPEEVFQRLEYVDELDEMLELFQAATPPATAPPEEAVSPAVEAYALKVVEVAAGINSESVTRMAAIEAGYARKVGRRPNKAERGAISAAVKGGARTLDDARGAIAAVSPSVSNFPVTPIPDLRRLAPEQLAMLDALVDRVGGFTAGHFAEKRARAEAIESQKAELDELLIIPMQRPALEEAGTVFVPALMWKHLAEQYLWVEDIVVFALIAACIETRRVKQGAYFEGEWLVSPRGMPWPEKWIWEDFRLVLPSSWSKTNPASNHPIGHLVNAGWLEADQNAQGWRFRYGPRMRAVLEKRGGTKHAAAPNGERPVNEDRVSAARDATSLEYVRQGPH